LADKERCPGAWLIASSLHPQVSDEFDRMSGVLLLEHLPEDSCQPDDRRLDTLTFEPTTPDEKSPEAETGGAGPSTKPFSSGG
jgi:hypothetical protein